MKLENKQIQCAETLRLSIRGLVDATWQMNGTHKMLNLSSWAIFFAIVSWPWTFLSAVFFVERWRKTGPYSLEL